MTEGRGRGAGSTRGRPAAGAPAQPARGVADAATRQRRGPRRRGRRGGAGRRGEVDERAPGAGAEADDDGSREGEAGAKASCCGRARQGWPAARERGRRGA